MKKLILAVLVLSSFAAKAEVLNCTNQTLMIEDRTIVSNDPIQDVSIELTEPVITMTAEGYSVEFYKDYNEYRNNTGRLLVDRTHNKYTMQTAIKDTESGKFVRTQVVYRCN